MPKLIKIFRQDLLPDCANDSFEIFKHCIRYDSYWTRFLALNCELKSHLWQWNSESAFEYKWTRKQSNHYIPEVLRH